MSRELYFLRSSEQKIVTDMYKYTDKNEDELLKYTEFFGLSNKDLGLYALVDAEIAGAIWARDFKGEAKAALNLAIVPKFYAQGIEAFMLEQFLQEAAAVLDELHVEICSNSTLETLYEEFGFTFMKDKNIRIKKLQRAQVVRPSDGYDAKKWMD